MAIPDTAFLFALIDEGVDTNGDSLISYSETEATTNLTVSGESISDMTGIEAFINLDTLDCEYNQLTSLDVSKNTSLTLLFTIASIRVAPITEAGGLCSSLYATSPFDCLPISLYSNVSETLWGGTGPQNGCQCSGFRTR